ncbi:MAG: DUF4339 domain-containing protein [Verrucomicrobia bacterium]|nr:DUF4339 domain-containing protein [Verrucomicrobiota bacterium]
MQIYINRGGQQLGPYDVDAIKAGLQAGSFSAGDQAWYEGAPGWVPLSTLPGFTDFAAPPPAPFPPPPAAPGMMYPGTYPAPQRQGGNKAWVWIASGCGFLLLLAVGFLGVVGWIGYRKKQEITREIERSLAESNGSNTPGNATPGSPASTPPAAPTPPAAAPAAGMRRFVSDRSRYDGERAQYFVDFTYDYPATWTVLQGDQTKGAGNFVETVHTLRTAAGSVDAEKFNVGNFHGIGMSSAARVVTTNGSSLVGQLEMQLTQTLPNYKKISEGRTKVGNYEAYELRASARISNAGSKDTDIWMRWILVAPSNNSANGVVLALITTSQIPGMRGIEDVGTKGELAAILSSFRFGK